MIPLTQVVDHTLLKADATPEQIRTLCGEAKQFKFFSVCVNPTNVAFAKHELKGTDVKVATVVGFPLGANTTATKVFETKTALELGADEIDMVINIGAAKAHDFAKVESDIRAVVDVCRPKIVKVIIETALLTDAEKVQVCLAAKKAHANFVKTSTGFSTAGATLADIRLMRETIGPEMGIKASGGLKTLADFEAMIEAGATRLGTSSAVQVLRGQTHPGGY